MAELTALATVIMIDIVLAGDNAVVVGLAAAGLPAEQQRKVLLLGVGIALVCRIIFALVALQLLAIIGLVLAGGILLLWVAWKMWRDLRKAGRDHAEAQALGLTGTAKPAKSFASAVTQVAIADISMSLDNVLAVAGAARDHMWTLIFGLALSIALMGIASGFIAKYMDKYRWLSYFGLVVVLYVALSMIWEGSHEVLKAVNAPAAPA